MYAGALGIMYVVPRQTHRYRRWPTLWACLALLWVEAAPGQEPLHWRFWSDPNALLGMGAGGFNIGPSGRAWWSKGPAAESLVCWYDGYEIHSLPRPGLYSFVREGHNGQIWALNYDPSAEPLYSLSHYVYEQSISDGKWVRCEIGALEEYIAPLIASVTSGVEPFVPAGKDRLFFVCSDELLEFNAASSTVAVLKRAEETGLGTFISMAGARGGGIWVTGKNGLAKVDGAGLRRQVPAAEIPNEDRVEWREFQFPEELELEDLASPSEGNHGEVLGTASWFHNPKRVLVRFDGETWQTVFGYQDEDILMGWRGTEDTVWLLKSQFPTDPAAPLAFLKSPTPMLARIQNGREELVERKGDLAGYIRGVAVEPGGAFWLRGRGVRRHAPPTWRTPPPAAEIDKQVYAIHEDQQGRLWFGSAETLTAYENGEWKIYRHPEGKQITTGIQSLCSFPDGRIAIVTRKGPLLVFTPGDGQGEFVTVDHPSGRLCWNVASREDGTIWVLTADGRVPKETRVEIFDGERFTTVLGEAEDLGLGRFHRIVETASGEVWLAGEDGIGLYRDGVYRRFKPEGDDRPGFAYCITEMGDGVIWVGGPRGILEFDGETWTPIRSGIANVHHILKRRDGSIWAATQTGIHRLVDGSWVRNTHEDGLPTSHIYMLLEDGQDRLWTGTAGGLALYHPEADPDPPMTIVRDEDNLRETPPGGDVRLIYSAVDRWKYTKPERLLFQTRLDGGAWSPFTADTLAPFTGLVHGTHRFEVRTIDRNWNIDPNPVSFEFNVSLAWYREPVFLIAIGVAVVVIVLLLVLHISNYFRLASLVEDRTMHLTDANQRLREHRERLQALASELSLTEERERRRLATDLHDSISQSLSLSIMELSTLGDLETTGEAGEKAAGICERLDRTLQSTQNLTFELCPPELYQIGLEAALQEMALHIQKQHGLTVTFEDDEQPKPVAHDVRYFLFRATRELLLNVLKYADASRATVRIGRVDTNIQIQVSDDGKGIESGGERTYPDHRGGFGLFNIHERVNRLGGSLKIESIPGEGTTITLVTALNLENEEDVGGAT